ncbi:MAG TPA: RNA methyltransferase [Bacteroidales bacterium]|nr:RNA methyltransferase [Bacteroidales bacterium]HPS26917.1 RNA methyltransferase [Bacteroidales bacterium]
MRKTKNSELNRLSVDAFKEAKKNQLAVVLDNIRSMNNIGSVFRTCDAFRVEKLLLCGITATPPHREIHRTALGATESVDWEYYETTQQALTGLKEKGFLLVAIEQTDTSISLEEYYPPASKKMAFVFGNEINGIDEEVLDLCDFSVEIPQFGTKHSINVSVSAGIILWDMVTKMWKTK